MTPKPDCLVVVVMPVFNAMETLQASVESILNQTWANLRLIAVNDGSSDGSLELLSSLAASDDRLVVIDQPANMGPGFTANAGLRSRICDKADFIARADADDINDPTRIAEQVKFLSAHPDIDICGTSVTINGRVISMPSDPCLTRLHMLFYCSLANPSTMFRASALKLRFSIASAHRVCEDYRLWLDLLLCGRRFVNIPGRALVHLRRSPSCISIVHAEEQRRSAIEAARETISALTRKRNLTSDQILHVRDPSSIGTLEHAVAAHQIVSALRSCNLCQCSTICTPVYEEFQKRLGEIAIIAMQMGDTSLFQEWLKTSSNTEYLSRPALLTLSACILCRKAVNKCIDRLLASALVISRAPGDVHFKASDEI